jgi:hypothetical protein
MAASVAASQAGATEAGPGAGSFTITRNHPIGDLTVHYTLGGTATAGTDYTVNPSAGSVLIPDGQNSANVTIIPKDDTVLEGDETVVISLSPNAYYTVTGGAAVVSIADHNRERDWQNAWWPGVSNPLVIAAWVDPDGDGMSNVLERALGTDPTAASVQPAIVARDNHLQITFTRARAAADIIYRVETSDDLVTWSEIWNSVNEPYGGGNAPTEELTIVDPVEISNPIHPERFLRLHVNQ